MEKLKMLEGIRLNEYTERFMRREERARMVLSDILTKDKVDLLLSVGYAKAPASTSHHGAYEGGLFDHCWYMARVLNILTEKLDLKWGRKDSPAVIAFLHDMCKIDRYKYYNKDGEFVIELNDGDVFKLFDGHGKKSVQIIEHLDLLQLTDEELTCIKYHMGAYDPSDTLYLSEAAKQFPNLYFVQLADCIVSQLMEV